MVKFEIRTAAIDSSVQPEPGTSVWTKKKKGNRAMKCLTGVGQQVGGQQAGEPRVQQPGAFLDPCA